MDEPAEQLCQAVEAAVPGWVAASVHRVARMQGLAIDAAADAEIRAAGEAAVADLLPRLRALLAADVDAQRLGPLQLVRSAVPYPARVLRRLGARPVTRDDFARASFPDDEFGLSPAAWSDLGEAVHEAGIVWGAWKAKAVLDRRRVDPST